MFGKQVRSYDGAEVGFVSRRVQKLCRVIVSALMETSMPYSDAPL
jgi:hypothetical protein